MFLQNMGDVLAVPILRALGYRARPRTTPDAEVVNPGRCLLAIGSLLSRPNVAKINWPSDIWGCGWRGAPDAPPADADLRYFAVRGPKTAAGLGLPADIPLGDPALLLPQLYPGPHAVHGLPIIMPHLSRYRTHTARARCAQSGCAELVLPRVLHPDWGRRLLRIRWWEIVHWLRVPLLLGCKLDSLWGAIHRIAGASFVLTGSLHGAILAQAYGVPWAALDDDGFVDVPHKWEDWAEYMGIDLEFVTTLAEGRRWWEAKGRLGRVRPLGPLLNAFPYPLHAPTAQHLARTLSCASHTQK